MTLNLFGTEMGLMDTAINVVWVLTGTAMFLAFFRLVRGPSLPDRVVALDLIAAFSVGIIATYSITTGLPIFLDVAVVVALIAFLGTVAFSRYLERRGHDE